ncbi:MAG: TylF/MycF family methyltransferase [Burkholderiales bacterium]|nr:TylF/MycF family methyltransferase [Burkholderiales bacterium]
MLKNLLTSILRCKAPAPQQAHADYPGKFTFAADGLQTVHNAGFLDDTRFRESYALGANSGHRICAPADLHIEWRVYICCWAAQHGLKLRGDFVECGVSTGIVSRAVAHYVDFGRQQKRYWLIDTFDGIPLQQASAAELSLARSKNDRHYYDCYPDVKAHFSRYGNVEVIKGRVPEILDNLDIAAVAFLHIDMNIAEPEVQAMRHFWDKLTPGAAVVFDDYASMAHQAQKAALDAFAASRGFAILSLPTGQGLALKN